LKLIKEKVIYVFLALFIISGLITLIHKAIRRFIYNNLTMLIIILSVILIILLMGIIKRPSK